MGRRPDGRPEKGAPVDVADRERRGSWEASVERDRERRRRELDAERHRFHAGQAERLRRTMTQLVEHHEREAERLEEGGA